MSERRAIVVGAGIGGLTAALALARKGLCVTVIEQAAQLGEVGAGIQLSPNATRVLLALGVGPTLAPLAFRPEAAEVRSWKRGALLNRLPLGEKVASQFGAPYFHVHRADLIAALAEAVAREPRIEIRLGAACAGCETGERGAEATLAGGELTTGDLLVGADGIRSAVREALFGPERARFTGNVAWRGLALASTLASADVRPVAGLWMGPGAHFVHYYVRGGALLNFVGIVECSDWLDESWNARGDKRDLLRDFSGWHPTVRSIAESAPEDGCFRWALFDRDPLARWSRGSATLLGDACHATLPFMAQGACMAIEDAAVLAECVGAAQQGAIPAAIARYESLRRARTTGIQLGSRRNARLYHMRAPASWMRNLVLRAGPGLAGQAQTLFGYDAFAAANA